MNCLIFSILIILQELSCLSSFQLSRCASSASQALVLNRMMIRKSGFYLWNIFTQGEFSHHPTQTADQCNQLLPEYAPHQFVYSFTEENPSDFNPALSAPKPLSFYNGEPQIRSIYETLSNAPVIISPSSSYTTFLLALDAMGMSEALSTPDGQYTVFAPTDEAFESFFSVDFLKSFYLAHNKRYSSQSNSTIADSGSASITIYSNYEKDFRDLQSIINYHIIENRIVTTQTVSGTKSLFAKNGNMILFQSNIDYRTGNSTYRVNDIPVKVKDLKCKNGVVHSMSKLLIPKLNAEVYYESEEYRTQQAASMRVLTPMQRSKMEKIKASMATSRRNPSRSPQWLQREGNNDGEMTPGARGTKVRGRGRMIQLVLRLWSRKSASVIDGTMAGDLGFDPLGFSNTKERLNRMREIELKHSRIAMLAVIGWPMSELFHEPLAKLLKDYIPQVPPVLDEFTLVRGQAPTVLNGGLTSGPNAASLGIFTLLFSIFEYFAFMNRIARENEALGSGKVREPGDFGFDPLALYQLSGSSPTAKLERRNMEIRNGRMAMVAMLIFFIMEFTTGKPVVEITPVFFKPIWELI